MRRKNLRRYIVVWPVLIFFLFSHSLAALGAGRARLLTDEKLDGIYAQGLSIVNISFNLHNIGSRFNFSFESVTKIQTPDNPRPNAGAKVDFLGGLISVSAGSNSNSTETPNVSPVVVNFGQGPVSGNANTILSITTIGINVNSVANIRLDQIKNQGLLQRQVRSALGRVP